MRMRCAGIIGVALVLSIVGAQDKRPNILFMIADDMTADLGHLGHPVSKTPTMDRLASEGVSFNHMYSNHPICGPSRTSFLWGILGQNTGTYYFVPPFTNPVIKASKTFVEHLSDNGYLCVGTGKIAHWERAKPWKPRDGWAEYGANADYSPFSFDGTRLGPYPDMPDPLNDPTKFDFVDLNFAPLSKVPYGGQNGNGWAYANKTLLRYNSEDDRDPTPDEWNANWAVNKIREFAASPPDRPFFLGLGLIRPHTPVYVPDKYFDMYPLDSIPEPVGNDVSGTRLWDILDPSQLQDYPNGYKHFDGLKQAYGYPDGVRLWTQAYLAGIRATDDLFGVVIDALDKTKFKHTTIVIITGDNGWSSNQHNWVYKNGLWDATTRVPLIIRAPGLIKQPGTLIESPVSLIDIYPTLVDVCQLTGQTFDESAGGLPLDGFSILPLLEGKMEWTGPSGVVSAISGILSKPELLPPNAEDECYVKGHNWQRVSCICTANASCNDWTIRTQNWRYIRYNDCSEELYNYEMDPFEQHNLADDEDAQEIKEYMMKLLFEQVPTLNVYSCGLEEKRRKRHTEAVRLSDKGALVDSSEARAIWTPVDGLLSAMLICIVFAALRGVIKQRPNRFLEPLNASARFE